MDNFYTIVNVLKVAESESSKSENGKTSEKTAGERKEKTGPRCAGVQS